LFGRAGTSGGPCVAPPADNEAHLGCDDDVQILHGAAGGVYPHLTGHRFRVHAGGLGSGCQPRRGGQRGQIRRRLSPVARHHRRAQIRAAAGDGQQHGDHRGGDYGG
jgi:hypothetical protein